MLTRLALLSFFALPSSLADEAVVVEPRPVAWSDVGEVFDLAWQLPDARPGREADDVLPSLRALVALRDAANEDPRVRSLAELVKAVRSAGEERERVLREVLASKSPVVERARPILAQLLRDEALFAKSWDPDDDGDGDGVAPLAESKLPEFAAKPWTDRRGTERLHAAAVLVFADLEAIQAVEHDFRTYLQHPGSRYESIGPKPASYVRGIDADGRNFAALRMQLENDLPWPFSSYDAEIAMLHRFDAAGELVTDLYSTSSDFHWLAGQDVYLPLVDEGGAFLAYLLVRRYGFDLDGVPDKAKHQRAALRASLGNLKRDAETRFRESARELRHVAGQLPDFRVLGPPRER